MKSIFSTLFLLFACNFVFSQCSIFGLSAPAVGQTSSYAVPSNSAQCGSCYDWDVSGSATIVGSDMGNSVQIQRTGSGAFNISLNYITESGCQSCTSFIQTLNTCNFNLGIMQQYFLGLGYVGVSASTTPQPGSGASYSWTFTYQNSTTYSTTTSGQIVWVPATTANKIVSGTVTLAYQSCVETASITFFNPIPEVSGFGKANGGNSSLDDPAADQKFKLYPNPTSSSLQVEGADLNGYTISIYDMTGKFLAKNEQLGQQLNLADAAPGMYMYVITNKDGYRQAGKIVRE